MRNGLEGSFLVLLLHFVVFWAISPMQAQPLPLDDDDAIEVALPFTFPFFGNNYNSVWVGSNGFLTFGAGDTDPLESVADLQFGPPRIAALWDDLDPSAGGTVTAATVGPNFVVTFNNVPEFDSTNSNSFVITLRPDGTFNLTYQTIEAADGIVGRSPGNGHGGDPGEIDMTAAPQPIGAGNAAMVYENFDGGDNDLSGASLEFAAGPPLIGPPDISVSPVFFILTLPQGVVTTETLDISNTAPLGSEALNWQVLDEDVTLKLDDGRKLPVEIKHSSAQSAAPGFRELRLGGDDPQTVRSDYGLSARGYFEPEHLSISRDSEQKQFQDVRQSPATMAPPMRGAGGSASLVIDDGSRETSIGLSAGGQFLWLNRFTPFPADFPFTLNQVWVLFGPTGVNVGELVDIYIWEDTDGDGDPGTGAALRGSILNAAVQTVNDSDFSKYTLSPPITLNGPGDVLIGVVNRTAGTDSTEFPAAMDRTASVQRSWVGTYMIGDPPNPPPLPADDLWALMDQLGPQFAGNWMIRGFEGTPPPDCPWLSGSPVIGTTPPGDMSQVTVTIDATGLSDGVYNCELVINSNDPDESLITVPVQLTVAGMQQPPDIDVTPTSFTFNVPENGLSAATMTISNTAPPFSQNLIWSITETPVLTLDNGKQIPIKIERSSAHSAGSHRELPLHPAYPSNALLNGSSLAAENPYFDPQEIRSVPISHFPAASEDGRQVSLIIDDGTRENAVGLTNGGQFIWLNRFTPDASDFPFTLNEVWVLFGAGVGVNVGELVDIYIYEDTDGDGDPGTNANFLTALNNAQVQFTDDINFSQYTIPPTVLNGPGDVIIAVVNRTAGTDPGEFPAALDQTTSLMRSWVGIYNIGDPPDPPPLPADNLWGIIDQFGIPGNWMVRGFEGAPPPGCPWISESPVSGTTAPGDSVNVRIQINAQGLAPGTYQCDLSINSNDPDEDPFVVPVTLNVGGQPQKAQGGICYASTGLTDGGRLLTIDETTGAGTLIGASGLNGVPGLAINSNGSIFGTRRGTSGDLYRIDAATGSAVFVGSTGIPFLDAIAFDDNDVLYGVGFDPPDFTLVTIDTSTGATTPVGPTGDIIVGMAFDASSGLFYGSVGGFQPVNPDGIYTINPATGAATFIGATGLGGATPDLCLDAAGNLFASKGGGQNPNDWVSINKATGAGTVVGPIGFTAVSGLASFSACTPGILGDVNGDGLANSTDALIIQSFDAGLPIPPPILDRINLGFGDGNGDGFTNSTDALLMLSFDVGIPIPFPVGNPVCL